MGRQSGSRWAEVLGLAASRAPRGQSGDLSLLAANDTTRFPEPGPLAEALFRQEGASSLREGYVFTPHPNLRGSGKGRSDTGQWTCDLRDCDRLTWSHAVYDLFGLPVGAPVERDWAVARYAEHSQSALQRVRGFALRHGCGFMLDAEIAPEGADRRWIRVLALPEFQHGQIVRLHGLKRML